MFRRGCLQWWSCIQAKPTNLLYHYNSAELESCFCCIPTRLALVTSRLCHPSTVTIRRYSPVILDLLVCSSNRGRGNSVPLQTHRIILSIASRKKSLHCRRWDHYNCSCKYVWNQDCVLCMTTTRSAKAHCCNRRSSLPLWYIEWSWINWPWRESLRLSIIVPESTTLV
jgi:hypothetical protein